MESNENKISRRKVIGSLGLGVAALAATPVFGSSADVAGFSLVKDMEDPTTKYSRPPFKEQKQPWPGLVSQMNPRPDHGETSYKGSGRLAGRKALVTVVDSGMGRAASINYLPAEEPDAREVIELIKKEGRAAVDNPYQ